MKANLNTIANHIESIYNGMIGVGNLDIDNIEHIRKVVNDSGNEDLQDMLYEVELAYENYNTQGD